MFKKDQVFYLIRESFAGFHRRKLTTGVTILIMGSALLVLAILTLATLNMGNMLEKARAGIDMRVYLHDGLAAERMAAIQPRLMIIPGVQQVTWISPATALAQFRESLGEDAQIMDLLDSNPLPASYHLTLTPEARNLPTTSMSSSRRPYARSDGTDIDTRSCVKRSPNPHTISSMRL